MFNKKIIFFTLLGVIFLGGNLSILSINNTQDNTQNNTCDNNSSSGLSEQDSDGLDFIDELIEAPKNPDAKPSSVRIPNFIREYGMRSLELMFYLRNSVNSRYQAVIRNLKTIYYRV